MKSKQIITLTLPNFRKMIEGYTELIKIAENGLKNNPEKVKGYMEVFIKKFPNHDLSKPFKSIINNDTRTLVLCCDDVNNRFICDGCGNYTIQCTCFNDSKNRFESELNNI